MALRLIKAKQIQDRIIPWLLALALVIFFLIFGSLIISIGIRGFPVLSLELIFSLPKSGFYLGREGGIANALVGSLIVSGCATLLALAISLPLALFLNVYLKRNSRLKSVVTFCLDILWGIPSIVYGACGILMILAFELSYSLLAAIIIVTLIEIPILTRGLDEIISFSPPELLETGFALGANYRQVAWRIVLRKIGKGIISPILLAFGRGIGDAAAVMLVAGFTDKMPTSLFKPVATLPLSIYYLVSSHLPEVRQKGYAGGLILIFLILTIASLSRLGAVRKNKIY